MKEIVKRIAKLINVKSIVTVSLTIGFLVMCYHAQVTTEQFLVVYSTIIAFYFSTQANKQS